MTLRFILLGTNLLKQAWKKQGNDCTARYESDIESDTVLIQHRQNQFQILKKGEVVILGGMQSAIVCE